MLDLKKHLTSLNCTIQKQFKLAEDCCICLVQRSDGSRVIWRLYDQPVFAYKTLISTKCPQLPEVYRFTEIDCGGCLVEEEFIDGISLAELIGNYHLDELQTAAIVYQICSALTILHHKNMVHRDIKPENILITSNGRIVLIDLDAVSPRTSSKDRDTQLLGTVGYAAPEQYGFGHSDGRTDIFGIGVLMNVLLTGKHPVQALTDGFLRPVVEKCIAINVDQRYTTVEELMEQLPDCTAKTCPLCGFTSPGGGCIFCGIHTENPPIKRCRKRKWPLLAAGIVFAAGLCCAAGAGFYANRLVSENQDPASVHSEQPVKDTVPTAPTSNPNENLPEFRPTAPTASPSPSVSPVPMEETPNVPSEPAETPAVEPEPTSSPISSPPPEPEPTPSPIPSPPPEPEPTPSPTSSSLPEEDEPAPQESPSPPRMNCRFLPANLSIKRPPFSTIWTVMVRKKNIFSVLQCKTLTQTSLSLPHPRRKAQLRNGHLLPPFGGGPRITLWLRYRSFPHCWKTRKLSGINIIKMTRCPRRRMQAS